MVKLTVKTLGQRRPTCYARPALREAADAHDRKDIIAAGCWLYEATRRYLLGMCEAHKIEPVSDLDLVVGKLLAAKQLTGDGSQWLHDAIMRGENCQRCRYTMPALIEGSIGFLHLLLDHSPELELPTRGGQK